MMISDLEVLIGMMAPMLSVIGFAFVSGYLNPRSHRNQFSAKTMGIILLWLIGPVLSLVGIGLIPLIWYGVVLDDDGFGVKRADRVWPYIPGIAAVFIGLYLVHLHARVLSAYGELMELEKKP